MGRHNMWRKTAKRERRRKIRQRNAITRDAIMTSNSEEFGKYIELEQEMERMELEQIEKINEEENQKWQQAEKLTMERWHRTQERLKQIQQKQLQDAERKKLEWEKEQKKIKEANEMLQKIKEENERLQKLFLLKLENFLNGGADEAPEELVVTRQTKPDCDPCPFFYKTACCRFGDECSRNHKHCGISKVLLAKNFFNSFGIQNSQANEYDTDVHLEYEDSDTYRDFKEFYYDVIPEFEKFGKLVQFKVCSNYEKHLRGNTFVEFAEVRGAVAAYRALHARWYGGRQLSLAFCQIPSWKNAICGLQSSKRCPKGKACNFLHVFKNPDNCFDRYDVRNSHTSRYKTPERSWRWSESPERDILEKSESKTSRDRRHKDNERRRRRSSERSNSNGDRSCRDYNGDSQENRSDRSRHHRRDRSTHSSRSKNRRRSRSRSRS